MGYNTISTLKDFKTYNGGATDITGFGTNARSIPEWIAKHC